MVLGALRTQIQELQVHIPQVGTLSTSLMLRARMTNTIALPEGALVTENEADSPMDNALKGVGINMAALPWEMLYVL